MRLARSQPNSFSDPSCPRPQRLPSRLKLVGQLSDDNLVRAQDDARIVERQLDTAALALGGQDIHLVQAGTHAELMTGLAEAQRSRRVARAQVADLDYPVPFEQWA